MAEGRVLNDTGGLEVGVLPEAFWGINGACKGCGTSGACSPPNTGCCCGCGFGAMCCATIAGCKNTGDPGAIPPGS